VRDGVVECAYAFQQVRLSVSGSVAALSTGTSHFARSCHVGLCVDEGAGGFGDGAATDGEDATAPLEGMRSYLATCWAAWGRVGYTGAASDADSGAKTEAEGGAAKTAAPPAWVSAKLVTRAKALSVALRPEGAPQAESARAFDTVATLLNALAISKGKTVVDEAAWADLEALCERVSTRKNAHKSCTEAGVLAQDGAQAGASGKRGTQSEATGGEGGDDNVDTAFQAALLQALREPESVERFSGELEVVDDDEDGLGTAGDWRVGGERAGAGASGEERSNGQIMLDRLRAAGQL
jgi:hypothetical protein